jgi:hypothetical protein
MTTKKATKHAAKRRHPSASKRDEFSKERIAMKEPEVSQAFKGAIPPMTDFRSPPPFMSPPSSPRVNKRKYWAVPLLFVVALVAFGAYNCAQAQLF